jgi:hypothetical protein
LEREAWGGTRGWGSGGCWGGDHRQLGRLVEL